MTEKLVKVSNLNEILPEHKFKNKWAENSEMFDHEWGNL